MQKKLIALAVAGLVSAPVFAQTNVTVYGVADLSLETVVAKDASVGFGSPRRNRVTSNSSLIGFRGTEDLGNGLKALFQIESSIVADAGGGTLAGRDTFVGLGGGFGTVVAGKLTTIMRTAGAKVDFNPGATGIGFTAATYGTIGGIKTGIDERVNNAIAYNTPNFNGLVGQFAYVAGENRKTAAQNAGESINSNAYQLAVAYDNGPLYVSGGYHYGKDPQASSAVFGVPAAGVSDKLKDLRLAAKYSFPSNTSVSALYDRVKYDITSAGLDTDIKRTAWMVGAEQKFAGNQAAYLQYSRSNDLKGDACSGGDCKKTGFAQWTLGYTYSLSKRTLVKAYYTKLVNERDSVADFYLSGVGTTVGTNTFVSDGADPSGFGLGLRHTF